MDIKPMQADYEEKTRQLFNETVGHGLIYQPLDRKRFKETFVTHHPLAHLITFVGVEAGAVIGFISGSVLKSEPKAYLTMICVAETSRRTGLATALLNHYEAHIQHTFPKVKTIDLIFFNPVLLPWEIPGTAGHDHPGAPGVPVDSEAYVFFEARGYQTFVKQNVYYKNIEAYEYPQAIQERLKTLKDQHLTHTFYDPNKHHGFDALFENLENPGWREAVLNGLKRGDPVLITEDQGKMIGFTGPLHIQASGRGYFAGIGVHSDYRGLGLGKVLFAGLCYELSQLGATFMTLFTGENNPARKIYEHADFSIVKTFANMRKEL